MDEIKKQLERLKLRFKKNNLCTEIVNDDGFDRLCGHHLPCPIHGGDGEIDLMSKHAVKNKPTFGPSHRLQSLLDDTISNMEHRRGPFSAIPNWYQIAQMFEEIANSVSVNIMDTHTAQMARIRAAHCYKEVFDVYEKLYKEKLEEEDERP